MLDYSHNDTGKITQMRRFASGVIGIAALISLSACSSRVVVPTKLSAIQSVNESAHLPPGFENGDSESVGDETVSLGCVAAWRKCLGGDTARALKDLQELERKYPRITTIKFMTGQVLEHSGKKKEAVQYYKTALSSSASNSMYLFKLAEAMRATGDTKGAVVEYKRLLELSPNFVSAKLGLAQALMALDAKSKEASEQIEQALKLEPQNPKALTLLKEQAVH